MLKNKILVLTILVSFASTGVWIEVAGINSFTPFKLIAPLVFLIGLISIDYKRVKRFHLSLILLIAMFFVFISLHAISLSSVFNIILLGIGFFGSYILYETLDRNRRKKLMQLLLCFFLGQYLLEGIFELLNRKADLFLFATEGRIDGWATEPSHFIFAVMLTITTYIVSFDISGKQASFFFLIFLPAVYFARSAYGYIFAILSLVIIVSHYRKNFSKSIIKVGIRLLALVVALIFLVFWQIDIMQRILDTAIGVINYDVDVMDQNAKVRLLPFFVLFQNVGEFNIFEMIFGHGLGKSKHFISVIVGINTDAGHLTSFLYDFGLFGFLWLVTLVKSFIGKLRHKYFISAFIIMMMFNMNVGTQMFWFSIFCLAVMRLEKRYLDLQSEERYDKSVIASSSVN